MCILIYHAWAWLPKKPKWNSQMLVPTWHDSEFKSKIKSHAEQEVEGNERTEVSGHRLKTSTKISNNRLDLPIYDKRNREITLIAVRVHVRTNYGLLKWENEEVWYSCLIYKCVSKSFPVWHGMEMRQNISLNKFYLKNHTLRCTLCLWIYKTTTDTICFDSQQEIRDLLKKEKATQGTMKVCGRSLRTIGLKRTLDWRTGGNFKEISSCNVHNIYTM